MTNKLECCLPKHASEHQSIQKRCSLACLSWPKLMQQLRTVERSPLDHWEEPNGRIETALQLERQQRESGEAKALLFVSDGACNEFVDTSTAAAELASLGGSRKPTDNSRSPLPAIARTSCKRAPQKRSESDESKQRQQQVEATRRA